MPDRHRSEPTRALTGASIVLLLSGLASCAPAGSTATTPRVATSPTPAAPATGAPSLATSPTPVATFAPSFSPPAGALPWPTAFDVPFELGTYVTTPPFEVPLTVEITEPGWFSGHADPEFIDLLRFDGIAVHEWPSRMIAFGVLDHVRGEDGNVPIAGLTPDAVLAILADRSTLDTTNAAPISLLGLDGARLDVHADIPNTTVLGKGAVDLRQGPQLDMRLVLLRRGDGLFMVALLTPPGGLEAGWEPALEVVGRVRLLD